MNTTAAELNRQYIRANYEWPFIGRVESQYGLPKMLLFAIGSRETNLTNELGDGGHGVGIFQRDDRSWSFVPPYDKTWYLNHPWRQAVDAAELLKSNYLLCGKNWYNAAAAYNAGAGSVQRAIAEKRTVDMVTTGYDYATDVWQRMQHLQNAFAPSLISRILSPKKAGKHV
jgi:hypothetical protein